MEQFLKPAERADRRRVQIEQRHLTLMRIAGDSLEGLFDAGEESVAQAFFLAVEPVAGMLEIARG